jgi:LPXTG-motif cell wall-anchored protein
MPARRTAAALTVAALAAGPAALLGAAPAHATGGSDGKAGAVVLRAGLDVSLLNNTADVPLETTLNEVQAPESADKTLLTAQLDGVDNGKPFTMLRADVATARGTADGRKSEGYANLVNAKVHLPGLPLLSLIEVEQVTSKAVCAAGGQPTADSSVLGSVLVLGQKVTLGASGATTVKVPGVGEVRLDLSKTSTTSTSAAATALDLQVEVDPLKLNVAKVSGRVTLVEATCESPAAGPGGAPAPDSPDSPESPEDSGAAETPGTGGSDIGTRTGSGSETPRNLAETGGSSATPYLAGGAALLVVAGAGTLVAVRRHRAAAQR